MIKCCEPVALQDFNQNKKERLEKTRHATVTKANMIIQKASYILALQEQKIILFMMTKIQPTI